MADIVKEKIAQAHQLLQELRIDLWLIFVRETSIMADPVTALAVGHDAVWPSAFLYTSRGETIAIIGNYDEAEFLRLGRFTRVIPYTQGIGTVLIEQIQRLDPKTIAVNYSLDDPSCDGLTHGMYLLLRNYLSGSPYAERLISAAEICSKLRSRKTETEIARLESAARAAVQAWERATPKIKIGQSEIEIAQLIEAEIRSGGGEPSFETIVNAGAKSSPGHGRPTDARLEPGDLLHVDFGVRLDDYCSDLQRLIYFRRPGETSPPDIVLKAFGTVNKIITESATRTLPGAIGHQVDDAARSTLKSAGYNEYMHALGHQLGRGVHDGGALIGPLWERYGKTPSIPFEEGNVLTLELGIELPVIGYVGLEEDIVITPAGGRFLAPRQLTLPAL